VHAIFSMISGIGVSYRAVEGLYSDGLVMMALRNLHVPLLKKKGITQSDVTNGTDYSLTVKNLMRRNLRIKPRRTEMKAMIRASNQRKREGHLLILLGRWALKKMYMSFGSGVKSGKEAFDGAMNFLKTVDVKLKSIRLDKYYSESSHVSRFDKDTAFYIIPKKYATLNGPQKWKDTMKEFVQNTMEYLEQYHQRSNSEAGFAADKKMLG